MLSVSHVQMDVVSDDIEEGQVIDSVSSTRKRKLGNCKVIAAEKKAHYKHKKAFKKARSLARDRFTQIALEANTRNAEEVIRSLRQEITNVRADKDALVEAVEAELALPAVSLLSRDSRQWTPSPPRGVC